PLILRGSLHRRPVAACRLLPLGSAHAARGLLGPRRHVQHRLPDRLRSGKRMRQRLRRGDALENRAARRAVPRITVPHGQQLLAEIRADTHGWFPVAEVIPLNRNLNVPCGCARMRISGPKSSARPAPTLASTAITPFSRYYWPHAQPLWSGVFVSNQ